MNISECNYETLLIFFAVWFQTCIKLHMLLLSVMLFLSGNLCWLLLKTNIKV
jgi:hypothetical protein